jgi:hypothetical protein
MDPTQLKATYEQTQFLSGKIDGVDKDLFNTQSHQNVEGLKSQYLQTQDILNAQERSQYANENRQHRNHNMLNESVKQGTADTKDTVFRTSAITNDYIKSGAGDIKDTVFRTNAITNDYIKAGNSDNLLATERVGAKIDDNVYRAAMDIDQNIYRSQNAVNDAVTLGRIEGQKNTNELISYLKANNDNNWSNFGSLTKDVYQGKAETILSNTNQYAILAKQASDNTSAIQMEGLKNKADLAKQMAFEYSDLKDKIHSSESNIKEVLRSQESDRLRDVLRATENKSLYFELKNNHHHHHGYRRRHH